MKCLLGLTEFKSEYKGLESKLKKRWRKRRLLAIITRMTNVGKKMESCWEIIKKFSLSLFFLLDTIRAKIIGISHHAWLPPHSHSPELSIFGAKICLQKIQNHTNFHLFLSNFQGTSQQNWAVAATAYHWVVKAELKIRSSSKEGAYRKKIWEILNTTTSEMENIDLKEEELLSSFYFSLPQEASQLY